ncbi:MAG: C25 family cysteine peptidase [Roseiflexaceae bacterium]
MRRLYLVVLLICACRLSIAPTPRLVAAAAPSPGNPCATQPGSFKLTVDRAGIYEVTKADLTAAGWSGSFDTRFLRLYHDACVATNEVALDRGADAVRFYGIPPSSRYSAASVYWLRQESGQGLPMATRNVTPAGAPLQSTAVMTADGALGQPPGYDTVFPGADGDHFFLRNLRAGETVPLTFTLATPAAGDSTLLLYMQGVTTGDHDLHIAFDQRDLGTRVWSGATTTTIAVSLGSAPLAAGAHVLKLSIPNGPIDAVLLDRAALRYPAQLVAGTGQMLFDGAAGARRYSVGGFAATTALLYDLRDPRRPLRLEGASVSGGKVVWQDAPAPPARYALLATGQTLRPALTADTPSNLAQGGADYLIVGYGPFLPAVAPLAGYYRGKGLRVATVDIQDVYDQFGGGELHPEALRSFLRYAYAQWARPAPTYVLLVGDGSYDFRNRIGLGWANFVPPYLADVDPWMNEAACDPCYGRAQTDDPRDQPLPDLLVGRLPVRSLAETKVVVDKTLGYLKSPPRGAWQATTLFLADNYREPDGQTDPAGDFAALADNLITELPSGFIARRFYYDPTLWPNPNQPPGNAPPRYGDPAALQQDFFRAFDNGAALVTYVGHANFWQWGYTAANVEPPWLWYLYDADARINGGRLPILLTLTCLTGFFHEPEPQFPTTDERLLLHPGGGIVASLSPAGKGVSTGHDVFGHAVLRALYSHDPKERSLGAAQLAGFSAVLDSRKHQELTFTYTLLGDPALHLPDPLALDIFLPLVRR